MLLEILINQFKTAFPDQTFKIDYGERSLSIPAKNEKVGGITIQDDEYELTVYIGNFTHWHAGCYEDNLSEEERAKYISSQVTEFLSDLFSDQVVMWGSHIGGGGFYYKDENPKKRKWFGFGSKRKEWVWSGEISS